MLPEYALIDSDSIYFRIGCVISSETALHLNWERSVRRFIDFTMREILRNTGCQEMHVAIKGRGNFRDEIIPDYKANRPKLSEFRKIALNYGHNYFCEKYNAVMAHGMEADDLVSIWAAECREAEKEYVVVGMDKDLLQIPGYHYNFVKRTHRNISEFDAKYNLYHQCLMGDAADNIKGIHMVGTKTAHKILDNVNVDRMWKVVKHEWQSRKAGDPYPTYRLLKMLTSFEELEYVQDEIENHKRQAERQAGVSERHVLEKQKEAEEVSVLPSGDTAAAS